MISKAICVDTKGTKIVKLSNVLNSNRGTTPSSESSDSASLSIGSPFVSLSCSPSSLRSSWNLSESLMSTTETFGIENVFLQTASESWLKFCNCLMTQQSQSFFED